MKFIYVFAFVLASCGVQPHADNNLSDTQNGNGTVRAFPTAPNASLTPGSLCSHPDQFRYPEHVAYCERDVDPSLKHAIMEQYDERFGFKITQMDRQLFKIDHYIPLCMGGSNQQNNLWPQHETVYNQTDPVEQRLCELMAAGQLKQSDAIAKMKQVKADFMSASRVLEQLH